MSISALTFAATQNIKFLQNNSGYASTTAGPTQNSFSVSTSSGVGYVHQQAIASGQTQAFNYVSGGQLDLVGQVANFTTLFSVWFSPSSGAVQVENTQSGGIVLPQLGLSGGGVLIDPGAVLNLGEAQSGYGLGLTASKGNLVFRAVSGGCLLSQGVTGI